MQVTGKIFFLVRSTMPDTETVSEHGFIAVLEKNPLEPGDYRLAKPRGAFGAINRGTHDSCRDAVKTLEKLR